MSMSRENISEALRSAWNNAIGSLHAISHRAGQQHALPAAADPIEHFSGIRYYAGNDAGLTEFRNSEAKDRRARRGRGADPT